jgi:diacylglycerol kinase
MIDFGKFLQSLKFAWHGIRLLIEREQSFRIQVLVTVAVTVLAFVLGVSRAEAAVLVVVTGSVLVLELLNSAVERLVDLFKPRIHEYAEEVKDIMAGAVLMGSIGAAVVGVIVFWPHLAALYRH